MRRALVRTTRSTSHDQQHPGTVSSTMPLAGPLALGLLAGSLSGLIMGFATVAHAQPQAAAPRAVASPAAAPPSTSDLARQHFNQAEVHYRQGEFRKALEEYKKAQSFKRHPALLFNIAQCYRQIDEPKQALFYYRLYLSESPAAPNREEVEAFIAKMQTRVVELDRLELEKGRVSIVTRPPGAEILLDDLTGKLVARSPATLRLSPGSHLIGIRLQGFEEEHRKIDVPRSQDLLIEVVLKKTGEGRPGTRPPGARPPDARRPGALGPGGGPGSTPTPTLRTAPFHRRWWFWTGSGLALAAVLAATYTGVTTLKMKDEWDKNLGPPADDPDFEKRFKSYRAATDGLLFGGLTLVAGVAIAAALVGRGRPVEQPTSPPTAASDLSNTLPRVVMTPSCGQTGCGLILTGRF